MHDDEDISRYEDGLVRLVERDKSLFSEQRYGTLSHCWGLSQPTTTTTSNIAQHRMSIPMFELPKSFRDAIRVAATLALRYLWVDSLCIVQDSSDYWFREAGDMSKICRYGYINIAATGGAHGAKGCFWERNPERVRPTHFSIHWSNTPDQEMKW